MKSEDNNSSVLIELKHVCRSYGAGETISYALRNFSLEVKRGEFIMIMGPSGCGKTTLLNVIGLLDRPTAGSYLLNGRATERLSSRKKAHIRSRQIGYIFQNFNLISTLPVIENVALPLVYSGKTKSRRLIAASDILETFHLGEREYYYPHQLSGGQQQRVCIARSLVNHPEIILADEPTGNLDSRSSHIVMEELRNIHAQGNTIIMVTHNPQLTTYATRVIHMLDGEIAVDIKTVADDDLPQITNYDEPDEPEKSDKPEAPDKTSQPEKSDKPEVPNKAGQPAELPSAAPASAPNKTSQISQLSNISNKLSAASAATAAATTNANSTSSATTSSATTSSSANATSANATPSSATTSTSASAATISANASTAATSSAEDLVLDSRRYAAKAPLGEISDIPLRNRSGNAFPVVGSPFPDKSIRLTSKPTMEDLVVMPSVRRMPLSKTPLSKMPLSKTPAPLKSPGSKSAPRAKSAKSEFNFDGENSTGQSPRAKSAKSKSPKEKGIR